MVGQSVGWGLASSVTHHCPQLLRSKKNLNSTQFIELYSVVLEQTTTLQPIGQAAEFKFESKFEPLPVMMCVIWQSLLEVASFDYCKINGQALGAALLHCLGGLDRQAQTQGVSKSAAVAAGSYRLAWGKHATTFALSCNTDSVRESKRIKCFINIGLQQVTLNCRQLWNWQYQSSAHHFTQSFNHSLVSEQKHDIGTKQHVPNWILCKATDQNQLSVWGKGTAT